MNEKYVQSKDIDDFSGLEDLLFNVYSIKQYYIIMIYKSSLTGFQ